MVKSEMTKETQDILLGYYDKLSKAVADSDIKDSYKDSICTLLRHEKLKIETEYIRNKKEM